MLKQTLLRWLNYMIIVIALCQAGWMLFDGLKAIITGDYTVPRSGAYAGQLGSWAKIVGAVGIEPRSTLMKSIFVFYGAIWLFIIGGFMRNLPWAWWAMIIAAAGSLWYAPVGTFLGLLQLLLLVLSVSFRE